MRRLVSVTLAVLAALVVSVLGAAPASAAAFVQHPDENCTFEPGDVPGVDVFFPAACTIITSDSGQVIIVARGQLPEGFTLTETFVGTVPCFGQTGLIVATVSGEVTATCHFGP